MDLRLSSMVTIGFRVQGLRIFPLLPTTPYLPTRAVTLIPPTDANRATMIRSSVYGNTVTLNMTAVPQELSGMGVCLGG